MKLVEDTPRMGYSGPMVKRMLALILVATLTPAPALAQQAAGVVTTLDGQVTVARAALPAPATLKFRDDVLLRDRITTGEQSLVKMLMGGKALVTMRESSVLTITEEAGRSTVTLDSGKIAYNVVRKAMQPTEIHEILTPNAIASVRGTVLIVEVERRSAQLGGSPVAAVTNIYMLVGAASVSFLGGPFVQLGPNQGITITGAVLGPVRRLSPADVVRALGGLQSRAKLGGEKVKPDANAMIDDLSSLPGNSPNAGLPQSGRPRPPFPCSCGLCHEASSDPSSDRLLAFTIISPPSPSPTPPKLPCR